MVVSDRYFGIGKSIYGLVIFGFENLKIVKDLFWIIWWVVVVFDCIGVWDNIFLSWIWKVRNVIVFFKNIMLLSVVKVFDWWVKNLDLF